MQRLLVIIPGLSFLAAGIAYYQTLSFPISLVTGLVALTGIATILLRHLNRIQKLRYKQGRVLRALTELTLWRPLLSRSAYTLMRAEMLVQAGLFDTVGHLLEDRSLPEREREHTRFCLCRAEQRYEEAEEALRRCLEHSSGPLRSATLVELAGFLAEHRPERLAEAFERYQQALQHPTIEGMETLMLALEGPLYLAGGKPEIARQILEAATAELEQKAATQYQMLPVLSSHRRHLARVAWALGDDQLATELLCRARDTYCASDRWKAILDKDLAALRAGEPLMEPVPDEVLRLTEERAQNYRLRNGWPGGTGKMAL